MIRSACSRDRLSAPSRSLAKPATIAPQRGVFERPVGLDRLQRPARLGLDIAEAREQHAARGGIRREEQLGEARSRDFALRRRPASGAAPAADAGGVTAA